LNTQLFIFANMQILTLWVFIPTLMVLAMQPDVLRGEDYIINGWEAEPGKYPFIAFLLVGKSITDNEGMCGGTILNKNHILTAAHCIDGHTTDKMRITVGERNPWDCGTTRVCQTFAVEKFIAHPGYQKFPLAIINDVAIIVLKGNINFDDHHKIEPIAQLSTNAAKYVDKKATVIGWGLTLKNKPSPVLKETLQTIMPAQEGCNGVINTDPLTAEGPPITRVCGFMYGTSAFKGDSGGPLVIKEDGKYTLIGIVSYGFGEEIQRTTVTPEVYTNVAHYIDWIKHYSKI